MYQYLLIALGSAIGGVGRYWLSGVVAVRIGQQFPWGTMLINVTGSLVIGFFATLTAPEGRLFVPGEWRQFFMVGVCGGYTTFSSFSLQTLNLAQGGEWLGAGFNIVATVILCLIAVWIGHLFAGQINALKGF